MDREVLREEGRVHMESRPKVAEQLEVLLMQAELLEAVDQEVMWLALVAAAGRVEAEVA